MSDNTRWVCPQCFTSIRDSVLFYKNKPPFKCRDHFNLDWIEIKLNLDDTIFDAETEESTRAEILRNWPREKQSEGK